MQKTILSTLLILTLGAVANSEMHYNAADAVRYAYKHTKKGCGHKTKSGVKACTNYWNITKYPDVNKYDGDHSQGTNCIAFVSECLVAGGIPVDDTYTLEWYYDRNVTKIPRAWISIAWFLGRIFKDADSEKVVKDREYNKPRIGVWDDLKPVIVDPKKAVAGDIAFLRDAPWKAFHHAVIVTKSYDPVTKRFQYTGHTSDVVDANASNPSSNNWMILHFNAKKATYTNIPTYEDVNPKSVNSGSSNSTSHVTHNTSNDSKIIWTTKHLDMGYKSIGYLTGKPTKNITSYTDEDDREYKDTFLHPKSKKTTKVYKVNHDRYNDEETIVFVYGFNKKYYKPSYTKYTHIKKPAFTIYHKEGGRRVIDFESKPGDVGSNQTYTWNGTYFTFKEGISNYFISVRSDGNEKNVYYIIYIKDDI